MTDCYSTVNALQEADRLDGAFLNKLLIKHSSGVSVLAAPGKFPQFHATNEAIDKLISVARQEFDNVIVDVGARLDLTDTSLFRDAFTIYLVTQAGIPELRNSNRLISQFFTVGSPKLEIHLLELQSITTAFSHLPGGRGLSAEKRAERHREKEVQKRRLFALCARSSQIVQFLQANVDALNGSPLDQRNSSQHSTDSNAAGTPAAEVQTVPSAAMPPSVSMPSTS